MSLPLIRSGSFPDFEHVADYKFERLGEVYVERVIWGENTPIRRVGLSAIAGSGYLCFRFWLPAHDQVVERYFSPDGTSPGTLVDVCAPLTCQAERCFATDLLLDVWIDSSGQVTVYNEESYEEAVRDGRMKAEQAAVAERRVRELTAAIARGRFPPPLVRNWRIDPARLKQAGE